MTLGSGNVVINILGNARSAAAAFGSVRRDMLATSRLGAALERSQRTDLQRRTAAFRRLEKAVTSAFGAVGKFASLLSKGFVLAVGASSAALLAFKAVLVTGRIAAQAWQVVMQGVAAGAATAAIALSTLAAAQREYTAASSSYAYAGNQYMSSLAMSSAALRQFTANQKIAIAGQQTLTSVFASISRQTPVTDQLVKATEALGDFAAATGDLKNLAGAGDFLAALMKSKSLTDEVVQSASKLGPKFSEAVATLKKEGKTSADQVLEALISGSAAASVGVQGTLQTVNSTLFGTAKRNFQLLRDELADLGDFFVEPATTSIERVTKILRGGILRSSFAIVGFGGEKFFKTLETTIFKLTDFFVNTFLKYIPQVSGIFDRMRSGAMAVRDFFVDIWDYMSGLERGADVLWNFVKALAKPIFGGFSEGLGTLQTLLVANEDKLIDFGTAVGEVFVKISKLFGEMRQMFFTALPVLESIVTGIGKLVSGIKVVLQGVQTAFGPEIGSAVGLGGMFMASRLMGGVGSATGRKVASMRYGNLRRGPAGFVQEPRPVAPSGGLYVPGQTTPPPPGQGIILPSRTGTPSAGPMMSAGTGTVYLTAGTVYLSGAMTTGGPPVPGGTGPSSGGLIVPGAAPPVGGPPPAQKLSLMSRLGTRIGGTRVGSFASSGVSRLRARFAGTGATSAASAASASGRPPVYGMSSMGIPLALMGASMAAGAIPGEAGNNLQNSLSSLGMVGMMGGMLGMRPGMAVGLAAPAIAGQYAESLGLEGAGTIGMAGTAGVGAALLAKKMNLLGRNITPAVASSRAMKVGTALPAAAAATVGAQKGGMALEKATGSRALGYVGGIGIGAASGAAYGAQYGPQGAIAGAVVGAVVGGISYAFTKSAAAQEAEAAATEFADRIVKRTSNAISDYKFVKAVEIQRNTRARISQAQQALSAIDLARSSFDPAAMAQLQSELAGNAAYQLAQQKAPGEEAAWLEGYVKRQKEAGKENSKNVRTIIRNSSELGRIMGITNREVMRLANTVGFDLTRRVGDFKKAVNDLGKLTVWKDFAGLTASRANVFGTIVSALTEPSITEEETRYAVDQAILNLGAAGGGTAADQSRAFQTAAQYEQAVAGGDATQAAMQLYKLYGAGGAMYQPGAQLEGLEGQMSQMVSLATNTLNQYVTGQLPNALATLMSNNKFISEGVRTALQGGIAMETDPLKRAQLTKDLEIISLGSGDVNEKFKELSSVAGQLGIDLGIAVDEQGNSMIRVADESKAKLVSAAEGVRTNVELGGLILLQALNDVAEKIKKWDPNNPDKKDGNGDTATQRYGRTLARHNAITGMIPGRRSITSGIRFNNLGSPSSDHLMGNAYDLTGDNLGTYANMITATGGFAEFHGAAGTRHLHVVPGPGPMGDTSSVAMLPTEASKSTQNVYNININPTENASAYDIAQQVMVQLERTQRSARERA